MRRAAPLRTSAASCSSVLASKRPKSRGSMLCSRSIWAKRLRSLASPATSGAAMCAWPSISRMPARFTRSAGHHSYLSCAVGHCASAMRKSRALRCVAAGRRCRRPSPRPWCSRPRRLMSSWRRARMPSLAPSCATPGACGAASSSASAAGTSAALPGTAIQGCAATAAELGRTSSRFSSIRRMKSSHVGCTRLGIFTSLPRTSFSSRKGKRPLTRPYMMTPMPQTSTLAP
mmetsp:Transcript_32906/g.104296  ORF Transcript_32906/g.104296 Transcript_32906/m.104296 type:complete len:231 (-) Transcript_32906:649-1341(-)